MDDLVLSTDLSFAECVGRGKVRDLYRVGEDLLLVATDRISAFDVVLGQGIPGKRLLGRHPPSHRHIDGRRLVREPT